MDDVVAMTRAERQAWLLRCAERLTGEGDHKLASEARAEAALLEGEPPPVVDSEPRMKCDGCGRVVTGRKRIERYTEIYLADWVLCRRCEHNSVR